MIQETEAELVLGFVAAVEALRARQYGISRENLFKRLSAIVFSSEHCNRRVVAGGLKEEEEARGRRAFILSRV